MGRSCGGRRFTRDTRQAGVIMTRKIKFCCIAVKWFDKVNGNTYHSVRIIRNRDGKVIVGQFQYGYGDQYRYTAIFAMLDAKWIPAKYRQEPYMYERENNYPIDCNVRDGLKRDCVANGTL